MAKKKKLTAIQREYNKELQKLKRRVRYIAKRGYRFTENPIPARPQRPTRKAIERLRNITTKELYKATQYYDIILNKYVSGTEEQALTRSRASKKAAETRYKKKHRGSYTSADEPPFNTDDVLTHVYELIANWTPDPAWSNWFAPVKEKDKNALKSLIDGAVLNLGRERVAINVDLNAGRVYALAWAVCYGGSGDKKDGGVLADLAELSNILYGRMLTSVESIDVENAFDSYGYENEEE